MLRLMTLNPTGADERAIAARLAMLQYAIAIRRINRRTSDNTARWAMREALAAQRARK